MGVGGEGLQTVSFGAKGTKAFSSKAMVKVKESPGRWSGRDLKGPFPHPETGRGNVSVSFELCFVFIRVVLAQLK